MKVSEEERSVRRRLLCTAMPDSSQAVLSAALELLDSEFGDQPSIRYSDLVKQLREKLDDHAELGGLLGKIMVLRNKPEKDLAPDPFAGKVSKAPQKNASTKRTPTSAARTSAPPVANLQPKFVVFNKLFEGLAAKVRVRGENHLHAMVEFMLQQELESIRGFNEWAADQGPPRLIGADEELHRVINSAFVWICQKFGPADADRVLAEAVRGAEQLPEAFEHSPRAFL